MRSSTKKLFKTLSSYRHKTWSMGQRTKKYGGGGFSDTTGPRKKHSSFRKLLATHHREFRKEGQSRPTPGSYGIM